MKVLVVDDDVVSRMVLMHLIDACGHVDIIEAEDGQDAWDQLCAGLRPAICFCDLRMPRLSGMELLERVKGHPELASMPFVLVTSANDTATVDQATGLGVNGYLVKPFQHDQVRSFLAPLTPAHHDMECETPQATMHRLGINGERLLVYLGGFQTQLALAAPEIDAIIASGDIDAARLRLDRLHAGCLTLGLNGAAEGLRALPDGAMDRAQVQAVLADIVRAATCQVAAINEFQSRQ
ncbi:response regulator [Massilia sp. PAMC28688]|uniref:response regulator n=1 Tax=Massilia sp. PAMC28688 TaxID=2861283 RepID=UPI001C63686C|nr:response regulator [Massilia sp. PAMC28688]QYF94020.1 response regulator [Massilia sp. PAMC28688]